MPPVYAQLTLTVRGSAEEAELLAQGDQLKGELDAAEQSLVDLKRRLAGQGQSSAAVPIVDSTTLLDAITGLLSDDGRAPHQQTAALDDVLHELTIAQGSGEWLCTATWQLPFVDGVGAIGPIAFTVADKARRGTPIFLANLGDLRVSGKTWTATSRPCASLA